MHYLAWIGVLLVVPAVVANPAAAAVKCSIGEVADLPVTMDDLRPMVSVGINGTSARFLADSGAFFSVISPGSAASLGLPVGSTLGVTMRGINGDVAISLTKVKRFTLAGLDIPNVQFIVGGSEVGSGAGVLGQNIWGAAGDVEYDLPHGMIRLMKAKNCGDLGMAYWTDGKPYSVVEIAARNPANPHTVGTVLVNNVKVHATFDTGAAVSILSLDAAARAGIRPDSPGVRPGGMMGGAGRNLVRTWIAPVDSFKVGDEEIRKSRIRIGKLESDTDMLVGADFFIAHRVYVSNSQHRLFLSYEGGPVFNLTARHEDGQGDTVTSPDSMAATPTDAEGFGRRGAVSLAQHDIAAALSDYGRAIDLAPSEPRYLVQRATAYLQADQPAKARADLDRALTLSLTDVPALMLRAGLKVRQGRIAGDAASDLDAAAHVLPVAADERLAIAWLYDEIDLPDRALAQFALWIKAHPDDQRRPEALNGRCRSRALLGQDLSSAMADCNAALRARPGVPEFLATRGLVALRQGNFARAIKDYDAGLVHAPRMAWALYGRGIAKLRTGDATGGKADIDAAIRLAPKLPERAKGFGITA
ncbi:retroviral-like aspartic protease family protein [Sphingomonas abietis]|uniref:Aspartyl protease family protein n=1 Tax=Sphingomonas abietis TaxID=3012344 RepID=A0ABY7NMY8_9SPHN|nr:aspartyl protease family protein [Sphingomonas abietis]WBO20871.1 aspartyl protease family protein [Sphingomonas abietis]